MRRRKGHGRPVGSTTAPSRFSWPSGSPPPELGDVTFEVPAPGGDVHDCERAFEVVGIEETSSTARPYRLIFERLSWVDALERVNSGAPWWTWWKTPPGQ